LPTNAKILCKAMPRDQLYDYTAFRGQHLRQLIRQELPLLDQIKDLGELDKEVRRLEGQASPSTGDRRHAPGQKTGIEVTSS
jgi:hypothetical protein